MIVPYLRPQDTITQILQQTAERTSSRRNPIVIGPQYELYLNDGRDLSGAELGFLAAGAVDNAYTDAAGDALDLALRTPDQATAELYGKDLEAEVANFAGAPAPWTLDATDASLRTIRVDADNLSGTGTLNATLDGRKVKVGDKLSVTSTVNAVESTIKRTVVSLVLATGSEVDYDGVKLDGPIIDAADYAADGETVDSIDEVSIRQVYTGLLDDSNAAAAALTTTAADWDYAASLGIDETVTGVDSAGLIAFEDGIGKIFLSYKAVVVPLATEGMIAMDLETEITEKVGETKLANWLGRGTLEAFKGNQNRIVYALRTGGDTAADFALALKKVQSTDQVYAFAVMTDDQEVMELVRDHCDTQSNKYTKNFRRAYVGTDSPGSYTHWDTLPAGGYRQATLAASIVTLDVAYREGSQFASIDVGATIDVGGTSGLITEILSDYEVLTDIAVGSTASGDVTIVRPDNEDTQAAFVIDRSKVLSSRRITNVWCNDPTVTEGGITKVIPNKFLAAEVAGIRCALLPQQGLTMTEILSADAAPSMYTLFEPETLDNIAANGTWVITQESEGGDMFIRHQLTTSTTEGALAYEDNVGVIVDEFGFAVKDSFRKYIGRRNATPDTIAEIDDKLKALASDFTEVDLADREIGPPILAFFDEKGNEGEVTVRQDGDLADTLMTYVLLRVPLPLNGINHYIDVEVSELLASEDN